MASIEIRLPDRGEEETVITIDNTDVAIRHRSKGVVLARSTFLAIAALVDAAPLKIEEHPR